MEMAEPITTGAIILAAVTAGGGGLKLFWGWVTGLVNQIQEEAKQARVDYLSENRQARVDFLDSVKTIESNCSKERATLIAMIEKKADK